VLPPRHLRQHRPGLAAGGFLGWVGGAVDEDVLNGASYSAVSVLSRSVRPGAMNMVSKSQGSSV
jgi:hypothetical protein